MTAGSVPNRSDEELSMAIVRAVADANDVTPSELDFVLADYIDTDALNQLGATQTASWTLSFELPENTVTVTNDGVVRVDGRPQATVGPSSAEEAL